MSGPNVSAATTPPPDYPRLRDIGGGVLQIDTGHCGNPGTIGVYALPLPSGGFALVESGPASTTSAVQAGLKEAGLNPADLRYLLVTHIHLDHASASGALLAGAPGAKLIVHERGARHMIDPSRLMASAERVYGDQLEPLWGRMQSVNKERVIAVTGGEKVNLGGINVTPIATPGHASHHVSYLLDSGTLFTGDSAGVRLAGSRVIRPALPPPDLDLELWEESLTRMQEAQPERLVLTHFGPINGRDAAQHHLQRVAERNRAWSEHILAGLRAGDDDAQLIEALKRLEDRELAADGALPGVAFRYKLTSDAQMTVAGVKRYYATRGLL